MALQRRTLLVVTGVGIGLAGCSGSRGTDGTRTGTPTDPADSDPEAQDVHVVVHNHLSRAVTASVTLSADGTVLVDDEVTVEPNGVASVDTGIDETGRYAIVVGADDRDAELSFTVDQYDLEMGSNVVFWIDEDDIRYGTED